MSQAGAICSASIDSSATRDGADVWTLLQQGFGFLFAMTLVWGVLAFPVYKGMLGGYAPVLVGAVAAAWLMRPRVSNRLAAWVDRPSDRAFVILVVVTAVLLRVLAVMLAADEPVSDHALYDGFARRMLRGDGYGPTAYYPPGVSFWLLAVYAVFGRSLTAALLANAAVGGLLTALTWAVGRHVVSRPAARLAALAVAVFPSLVLYSTTVGYDAQLGCALLLVVWLFVRRAPGGQRWWYVAGIGVVLGAVSFLKPIGLLLPIVLGIAYRRRGASWLRSGRNTILLTVGMLAALSPWIVRNWFVFRAFVPVTTSGGAALWVTNHPGADALTTAFPKLPPGTTELERNRILGAAAWGYLREHPDHLLRLAPAKAAYQWGTSSTVMAFVSADRWDPRAEAAAKAVINTAWASLCVIIVVAVVREGVCRRAALFWPAMALVAYVWAIHMFYEAQSRYHLPFLPLLCIVAAVGLTQRARRAPADDGGSVSSRSSGLLQSGADDLGAQA